MSTMNTKIRRSAECRYCERYGKACGRPHPVVYPTREDYAREVWASLDEQTQTDILADYGYVPMVWLSNAEWHEFLPAFTDNMDARHNGAVTFTRVEGGYTVEDEWTL